MNSSAEWLDVPQICTICRERELLLDGCIPTIDELELALKKLFARTDEVCVDGISVAGYFRRVRWDLVFMLRFYPYVHSCAIGMGPEETEAPHAIHNN